MSESVLRYFTDQLAGHARADIAAGPGFVLATADLQLRQLVATDTLIAAAIAERIATDYDLMLLPPITISCSHEHSPAPSASARLPSTDVTDVTASLERAGIHKLVVVNGHGGNYVPSNAVQEFNVGERRVALFPRSEDWADARREAGVSTTNHEDMHGGEAETSILLSTSPEVVRASFREADFTVDDRRHLLTIGVHGYSDSGIIGRPSAATARKGELLLDAFSTQFKHHLVLLR